MAIKVSGITVIDNDRNLNVGILTATSIDVPPSIISFSPTDASSDVSLTSNIVITFNANVEKGSGNITLRDGSASGTVIETIDVTSGSVSVSGGQATINPSDFPTGKDIYVVIDAGCFKNGLTFFSASGTKLLDTYNFSSGPITTSSFSPSDGATNVAIDSNIVITFSENITKGSGNITLRASSASGTVRQTIDVTSGAVSVSGTQATINPASDLEYLEDTYVVVDAGCFLNSDSDADSANAVINTYNFTVESDVLGSSQYGGVVICAASNVYWVIAPSSTEVQRNWYDRCQGITAANSSVSCGDWFIPSLPQLANPGWECRTYWDSTSDYYWSNCQHPAPWTRRIDMTAGSGSCQSSHYYSAIQNVRVFRCVSY